ncbi:hypothetical protein SOQ14_13975 [Erythrobacter sp. T5W1-R]|uniref:hypothetical protein n=1 Tax=Erythrobacter sp. T5W1-R TaxID=3101752 RepID=UPI002AFF0F41|nr:hypothetical protein [Erythrobacter sp. T5W1-R]MEA1620026.1 hypothetical protein [Erythrobacter sp. T5W1-R]
MKALLALPALIAAAPLPAQDQGIEATAVAEAAAPLTDAQMEAAGAVDAFMAAIGSDDKTLLARHMDPRGTIFIHNRMDAANPRVDVVPVAQHLERWAARTGDYEEVMEYDVVRVEGDMAQVWGPYSFRYNGGLTHCGINSISLVRGADGWKVANTSFSMVPPAQCAEVGADWEAAR